MVRRVHIPNHPWELKGKGHFSEMRTCTVCDFCQTLSIGCLSYGNLAFEIKTGVTHSFRSSNTLYIRDNALKYNYDCIYESF